MKEASMRVPPSPPRRGVTPRPTAVKSLEKQEADKKHKYGCLMCVLPDEVVGALLNWGRMTVDPEHMADDGLEDEPHITAKYGFTEDTDRVVGGLRPMLVNFGPASVRYGKVSLFPDSGDGAVLKLDVDSPDLHELYGVISKQFACRDRFHPDYKPHSTVAYIKPEFAELYEDLDCPLSGEEFLITEMVYSSPDRERHRLSMGGTKTMSWLGNNSGGALVKPPRFMGARPKRLFPPRVKSLPRDWRVLGAGRG